MMAVSRPPSPLCLVLALMTIALIHPPVKVDAAAAWSLGAPKKTLSPLQRRLRSAAAAAAISAQVAGALLLGCGHPALAAQGDVDWEAASRLPAPVATSVDERNPSEDEDAIRKLGLRPPTEDRPQIKFTGSGRPNVIPPQPGVTSPLQKKSESKSPIIMGLVYLLKEENRPDYSDTLVLTASTPSNPDVVLAGAKFPVAKARFPMQFSMYSENILGGGGVEDWYGATEGEDLIITGRICPEGVAKLPCTDGESTLRARGICKLVRGLPGMTEGQVVRSPASLALE